MKAEIVELEYHNFLTSSELNDLDNDHQWLQTHTYLDIHTYILSHTQTYTHIPDIMYLLVEV